jgi:hypothetical protein
MTHVAFFEVSVNINLASSSLPCKNLLDLKTIVVVTFAPEATNPAGILHA